MAQDPAKEGKAGNSVETRRPYERLVSELQGLAKINKDNGHGFDVAANVIDKMMEAESLDDIIAAGKDGPEKIADLLNRPFTFLPGVEFLESDEKFKEGTLGVYAILKVHDVVTGDEKTITTGAPNIVAALRAMDKKGFLDTKPTLVFRSRPTGNGEMYYLDKA